MSAIVSFVLRIAGAVAMGLLATAGLSEAKTVLYEMFSKRSRSRKDIACDLGITSALVGLLFLACVRVAVDAFMPLIRLLRVKPAGEN